MNAHPNSIEPRDSRRRLTIGRLMLWVLAAGLVFGVGTLLNREWPFRGWVGGDVNLGILCAILYLPVLPALFLWRKRVAREPLGSQRRLFVFLTLGFLGWLAVIFFTFWSILKSIRLL
jgi:hypothetical protein